MFYPLALLIQDTTQVVADTTLIPPAVVTGGFLGLLLTYHMALAVGFGSLLLAALNKWVPLVTKLGTWGKRLTLFLGTIVVMLVIKLLGGQPPADFLALIKDTIEALMAALISGSIWAGAASVTKDKVAAGR